MWPTRPQSEPPGAPDGLGIPAKLVLADRNIAKTKTYSVDVEVTQGTAFFSTVVPRLIKIDVEGFEPRVLRGLATTIAKSRALIITETVPSCLARCGSSVGELVQLMTSQNYKGFEIGLSPDHNDWALTRLANRVDCDVLWIPDGRMSKGSHARVNVDRR